MSPSRSSIIHDVNFNNGNGNLEPILNSNTKKLGNINKEDLNMNLKGIQKKTHMVILINLINFLNIVVNIIVQILKISFHQKSIIF